MFCFNIPDPNNEIEVADWVELFVTVNRESISKSELASYIEGSSGSEPDQIFLDDVWMEMSCRELLYGDLTPFKVESREIKCNISWEDCPEYLICLILDIEGNIDTPVATGKLFERISNEAIKNYLGGESIIYGFPSGTDLESISQLMNEKFIQNPPAVAKDRGVDIIAWKPFEDGRKSQIVILVQCAAGNNWKGKLLSVSERIWNQYIHFACPPLKGFTTPDIIDKKIYHEVSVDAGITLDRPRLFRYLINQVLADTSLRGELKVWCDNKLETLLSA